MHYYNCKLNVSSVLYFCYFSIVISCFILSLDIIPLGFKWITNKLVYLVSFLFIFIYFSFFNKGFNLKKLLILLVSILYLLLYLISKLSNYSIAGVPSQFFPGGFLYITFLFAFIIIVNNFSFKKVVLPFYASSFLLIIASILVMVGVDFTFYANENVSSFDHTVRSKGFLGFSGVYLNQNTFSIMCLVSFFIFFIQLFIYNPKLAERVFLYIFLSVSFLFVFLTLSRASIMAMGLFLSLVMLNGVRNKKIILCIIFIASNIVGLVLFSDLSTVLIERISNDGTSYRTVIWANAFDSIRNNFFWGVGYYYFNSPTGVELSAHNAYIQRLASEGFFVTLINASVLLLFFLKGLIFLVLNRLTKDPLYILFSAFLVSLLIHQFFENIINSPFMPVTLVLFLSIAVLFNKNIKLN